ncbi:coiled-coil domain-containing protein 42 homolog [Mya arenaria]|uniref:coiled-coil domain-containing protein 42 homolog n=1 Tax=Mya arenaria TaxID=6604 RepID=UPI0022E3DA9D|nr:coiled-coil domain-containing protein 42 homolog [Mya arenaria]
MAETVLDRQKLFELDLDNQKKNVFVTQLHDREDEDDITAFPVVKETGDKLIETGINTLQRTLLLKKEVEVDRVQAELEAKRYEFRERMEECAKRQIEIQKRQQKMKDRVAQFGSFLKENELKRRRAIQKYQTEVKLKEQKTVEMEQLQDELEVLKDTMLRLDKKVKQYKKFEDYLLRVIDVMPEDYLAASDDKMKGLMSRHRTLSDSNIHLVNKLEAMTDELEELKSNLDGMKNEHNKQVISINSELSRLQQVQEVESADNQKMENHYNATKGGLRQKRTELGVIMMAIDNIAEICHKRLDVPVIEMSLEQKLKKIMDYVNDRADVALMAQPDSDDESRSGSRRGSVDNSKRSKTKKKVTLNG